MIKLWISRSAAHWPTFLALLTIVVIGALARFHNLEGIMMWADSGRDVLVAKHIVEHGGVATVGPLAAGGQGLLQNPPTYYYFLAGLWWLLRSPVLMTGAFALMGTLCIVINYWSGRELGGRTTGLLAAAFTALSTLMLYYSHSIFQPYVMMFFLALTYLGCLKTTRQPSWRRLIVTTLSFFAALNLHPSSLIVAPVVLVVLTVNWYRLVKNKPWFWWLSWPTLVITLAGIFHLMTQAPVSTATTTYGLHKYLLRQLVFFLIPDPQTHQRTFTDPFLFMTYLFADSPSWWRYVGGGGVIGLSWVVITRRWLKDQAISLFLVITTLLSSVFLITAFSGTVYDTYFAPFYFLVFLAAAYLLTLLSQRHRVLAGVIAGTLLVGLNVNSRFFFNPAPFNEYALNRQVAQLIWADYQLQVQEMAHLFAFPGPTEPPALFISERTGSMPVYDWAAPSYWYFIEAASPAQVTTFFDSHNNIVPLTPKPLIYYLICREYGDQNKKGVQSCIENAFARKDIYRGEVDRNYQLLIDTNIRGSDVRVYRFWRRTDLDPVEASY